MELLFVTNTSGTILEVVSKNCLFWRQSEDGFGTSKISELEFENKTTCLGGLWEEGFELFKTLFAPTFYVLPNIKQQVFCLWYTKRTSRNCWTFWWYVCLWFVVCGLFVV